LGENAISVEASVCSFRRARKWRRPKLREKKQPWFVNAMMFLDVHPCGKQKGSICRSRFTTHEKQLKQISKGKRRRQKAERSETEKREISYYIKT
jgi:hypothetical protein